MGTRSLTHVQSEQGETLVTIYRQFDGYPSGVGAELADFLSGRAIVNGIGSDTPDKASNGMGCLAASLVAEWKTGIGGTYLEPAGSEDHWEEYVYTVLPPTGDSGLGHEHPTMRVQTVRGYAYDPITLYEGPAEGFDAAAIEAKEEAMA